MGVFHVMLNIIKIKIRKKVVKTLTPYNKYDILKERYNMKKNDNLYSAIEKFHNDNLYLPTRTIYFGKADVNIDSEESNEVNCITAGQVIKNLHILNALNSKKPITLFLNSPGGSWEDGMAIFDVIKTISSPVIIIGMGKIYSMATVIIQSAKKRILMPNSLFMIHDGFEGYVGDCKSMEAWAENSKHTRKRMYEIYYENMKKKNKKITIKKIEEMCSHDTILTAKETVNIGLADEILEEN